MILKAPSIAVLCTSISVPSLTLSAAHAGSVSIGRRSEAAMIAGGSQSFSRRSIFNAGAIVFSASMVLSVGGFAFHALASRRLGVEDYGALYALISLYGIAAIPSALFGPVVTKYAAEFAALRDESHIRGLIEFIARAFSFVGLFYVIISIVLAGPLGRFLQVPSWQIPVVGVMAAVGILSTAFRATAQGVHDYRGFAASNAAEGIAKVALLLAMVPIGLTIARGISAFLGGMLLGVVFVGWPLLRRYRKVLSAPITLDAKRIIASAAGAASLTITMAFMGFADVIIVKHVFPASDAGLYSAASLSARILLYFVGFVPAILIPQATHRHARGERTRQTVWAASFFVAAVSLAGVLFYRSFGTMVLHALVGSAFMGASGILVPYAGAMACLAMTNTLGSYGLATHRLAFVLPLLLTTLGTLAFIAVVHPTLLAVARELLFGNCAMLISLAIPLAIQGFKTAR